MSSNAHRRTLGRIERLEPKQMLAGDVSVSVIDGNLFVQGDELANQIAVTAGDAPGSYVIRGLDGTTVHLASSSDPAPGELLVTGVRRDMSIRMGAGDDLVSINDAALLGSLSISTDGGADRVALGVSPDPTPETATSADPAAPPQPVEGVRIGGSLRIAAGEGDDAIRVLKTSIHGVLTVWSGDGDDEVMIGEAVANPPEAAMLAPENAPRPEASVRAAHGMAIHLGAGDDALELHHAATRRGILVNGGEGNDQLRLSEVSAGQGLVVLGGRGDGADDVGLRNVRAHHAVIHTGEGDDAVTIVDSAFGTLEVALGDGGDHLAIGGVTARAALFQGGAGDDALIRLAENMIGRRVVRSFENLPLSAASTT